MNKETIGKFMSTIVRIFPGVSSYQDRESYREADKELRLTMGSNLNDMIDILDKIKKELAEKGQIKVLKLLDDLTSHMERISRSLQFLPRGYAALFDSRKVNEEVLDRLLEYDNTMKRDIEELRIPLEKLAKCFKSEEGTPPEVIRDVIVILERIEGKISERERIFIKRI
jgi:hypothetical protein